MAERRTVLPKASVDTLSIGISSSTNCDPPSDAEAKRTIFIGVLRNSAKLGGCLPIEVKLGGERPDPITVSDVYFLLSPYRAKAGCATSTGSRRTRLAPPG